MNTACKKCESVHEVFKTENGAIYQCDRTSCFLIEFAGHRSSFNVLHFISFKRKVDQIDIAELLLSDSPDIIIINPCGSERIFALSILQLLQLKELLHGTMAMLELNSILHERIYSTVVV